MSTQPCDDCWDCTYHYLLQERLPSKNVLDGSDFKFVKDENEFIKGFDLAIKSRNPDEAETISKFKAINLEKILTIKSGMTVRIFLSGVECVHTATGMGRVAKLFTFVSGVQGGLNNLDLTDPTIQTLINGSSNFDLGYLQSSKAVQHMYEGRTVECIMEAFRIIETNHSFKNYHKYKCIRDILSHQEQQKLYPKTLQNFDHYFGHDSFDLKRYNPEKGEIIINFESDNTKKTLFRLAKDLINECRLILDL